MRRLTDRLGFRLLLSHVLVVGVGVAATALLGWSLAGSFFDDHLRDMGLEPEPGAMSMFEQLSDGFADSFRRATIVAVVVGVVVAVAVSAFAAMRLLQPIQRIRKATRRLASGAYGERVPVPVETELAALAGDVNALGEALERVEERRVRLVAEVAHELRTPLTTIQGYMEALLDGVLEPSDEIYAATAREASRLQRVAADLSLLSRAEEGRMDLVIERLDLATVAADAAERLRPQFQGNGVALVLRRDSRLPVAGDPDRLAQVFTNIIGNALDHTAEGGTVEVHAARVGDTARVRVTDTGRGIPPDRLELIFERFYRIESESPGGTGIGLTIARRIARLHGGDVSATSAGLGRGASFTVSIPIESRRER